MSSIGSVSSAASAAPQQKTSSGGLQADKAKCEAQLSDWVTCASAKTPEGKAKIAEYTAKLATINAEIKQADQAKAQTSASASGGDAGSAQNAIAPVDGAAQAAQAKSPLSMLGNSVDTYA